MIVSLLALLGIVLIPFFKRRVYDDILMVLTALAIGTLFSDTMLHILPEILGVESEDESDAIRVPDYTLKVVGAMLGNISNLFYLFFWFNYSYDMFVSSLRCLAD